jgi:hypothetical protein
VAGVEEGRAPPGGQPGDPEAGRVGAQPRGDEPADDREQAEVAGRHRQRASALREVGVGRRAGLVDGEQANVHPQQPVDDVAWLGERGTGGRVVEYHPDGLEVADDEECGEPATGRERVP